MKFNEANNLAKENILLEVISNKYAKFIKDNTLNDIKLYNSKIIKVENKGNTIISDAGGIKTGLGTLNSAFSTFCKKVLELLDYPNLDSKSKQKIAQALNDFGTKVKNPNKA